MLSKILTEIDKGKAPYQAILDGGTSKMRPVCMVVITTVLGMIPLLMDPFFGAMAVCIMFGLSFAAVLSLIVTPVLVRHLLWHPREICRVVRNGIKNNELPLLIELSVFW